MARTIAVVLVAVSLLAVASAEPWEIFFGGDFPAALSSGAASALLFRNATTGAYTTMSGGISATAYAVWQDPADLLIYVGGPSFNFAQQSVTSSIMNAVFQDGDIVEFNVATFNLTAGIWKPFRYEFYNAATSNPGTVTAITGSAAYIYFAGAFDDVIDRLSVSMVNTPIFTATTGPLGFIARYNKATGAMEAMPENGLNNLPSVMTTKGSVLIVGGTFTDSLNPTPVYPNTHPACVAFAAAKAACQACRHNLDCAEQPAVVGHEAICQVQQYEAPQDCGVDVAPNYDACYNVAGNSAPCYQSIPSQAYWTSEQYEDLAKPETMAHVYYPITPSVWNMFNTSCPDRAAAVTNLNGIALWVEGQTSWKPAANRGLRSQMNAAVGNPGVFLPPYAVEVDCCAPFSDESTCVEHKAHPERVCVQQKTMLDGDMWKVAAVDGQTYEIYRYNQWSSDLRGYAWEDIGAAFSPAAGQVAAFAWNGDQSVLYVGGRFNGVYDAHDHTLGHLWEDVKMEPDMLNIAALNVAADGATSWSPLVGTGLMFTPPDVPDAALLSCPPQGRNTPFWLDWPETYMTTSSVLTLAFDRTTSTLYIGGAFSHTAAKWSFQATTYSDVMPVADTCASNTNWPVSALTTDNGYPLYNSVPNRYSLPTPCQPNEDIRAQLCACNGNSRINMTAQPAYDRLGGIVVSGVARYKDGFNSVGGGLFPTATSANGVKVRHLSATGTEILAFGMGMYFGAADGTWTAWSPYAATSPDSSTLVQLYAAWNVTSDSWRSAGMLPNAAAPVGFVPITNGTATVGTVIHGTTTLTHGYRHRLAALGYYHEIAGVMEPADELFKMYSFRAPSATYPEGVGSVFPEVHAVIPDGDIFYVGGDFLRSKTVYYDVVTETTSLTPTLEQAISEVAAIDKATGAVLPLGGGLYGGRVRALALLGDEFDGKAGEKHKTKLAIAGYFDSTMSGSVDGEFSVKKLTNVAVYDPETESFESVGAGVDDTVYSMAYDKDKKILFVGGAFLYSGSTPLGHIAMYKMGDKEPKWLPLGAGLDGIAYGMQIYDGKLYVVGDFTSADRMEVNKVAIWNIDDEEWSRVENDNWGDCGFTHGCYVDRWGVMDQFVLSGSPSTCRTIAVKGNKKFYVGCDGTDFPVLWYYDGKRFNPLVDDEWKETFKLSPAGNARVEKIELSGKSLIVSGSDLQIAYNKITNMFRFDLDEQRAHDMVDVPSGNSINTFTIVVAGAATAIVPTVAVLLLALLAAFLF